MELDRDENSYLGILVLEMRGIEFLLGNDVLKNLGDWKSTIEKKNCVYDLGIYGRTTDGRTGGDKEEVRDEYRKERRIPPRSMVAVAVQQTEAVKLEQEGAAWMIEPERKLSEGKGLTTGWVILRGYRSAFHIVVINLENRPTFIHQGTVLGE